MSAKLAHQTQKTAGIPNGMRTATVAAVGDGTVTISVAGGQFSSGVGALSSYAPHVGDTVAVFRQDSSWLILGLISPIGGGGRLNQTEGQSDLTATSGTTESAYDTVTVDVIEGARYHVKCYFPYFCSVAGDRFLVRLREGSGITGSQITYASAYASDNTGVFVVTPESDWVADFTGQQTFVVTAQRGAGTGTLTPKGATSQIRLLTVDFVDF